MARTLIGACLPVASTAASRLSSLRVALQTDRRGGEQKVRKVGIDRGRPYAAKSL